MLLSERRRAILESLKREGFISNEELTRRLNISSMTLWRDLKALEEQGLIRRVWGGAAWPGHEGGSDPRGQFAISPAVFSPVKAAIGRYAAEKLVGPGESITLEGGSTVTAMIPALAAPDLTLLTNGLNALTLANSCQLEATLLSCGGILNQETRTFYGPQAERFFADFQVDTAFLSAAGVTLEDAFTDPSPFYVRLKELMRRQARRTVVLIDSSKFGVRTLTRVLRFDEVNTLVTDSAAPPAVVDGLREAGIDVHLVDTGAG